MSDIYVNPLLHNNGNVKYDFRFSLDLSGVGEKADILRRDQWFKSIGTPGLLTNKNLFDVERISLPNKSAFKLINLPESTCVFESHLNVLSEEI